MSLPIVRFEEEGRNYELVLPNADRDHIQKLLFTTRKPYELTMLQDMVRRLTAGDLVLDVGANVGNHSIYLAAVADVRVYAFEPNENLCDALRESIVRNGLQDLVSVYAIGISDSTGKAQFVERLPDNLGAQSLRLGDGEISVAPIDSLDFAFPVRMLKVDVEGMEVHVLRGAQETIDRDRPILYIECRDEPSYRQIAAWAQETGYSYWETFNATLTHLFLPTELLSIDQRLEHLSTGKVLQDYRFDSELRRKRQSITSARLEISALQATLALQVRQIEELSAELARRQRAVATLESELSSQVNTLKILELEKHQNTVHYERALITAHNRLEKAEDDAAKLHRYGRQLENRYREVLDSNTWRVMEPVRRVLRSIKGQPAPEHFVPRLGQRKYPSRNHDGGLSQLMASTDGKRPRSEKVVIFLATYPARRDNLPRVVATLLPQCDVLHIYLNEYETIPPCLSDDRVSVVLGTDTAGNLKDNGKFFNTPQFPDCYHVFVDDDILYPPDYITRIVNGIKDFGYRAIIGFHGTIYNPPAQSYLRDRTVLRFYSGSRSILVDQLGTGTVGYHTSTCLMDLTGFENTGTADLWFAKRAAECGIPLVSLARPDDWLLPMPEVSETIFQQIQSDDSRESALLQEKLIPALRGGPRVRTARFLQSLYTAAHLKRRKLNLDMSQSGAFGAPTEVKSDIHFALIVTGWDCKGYISTCLASIEQQIIGDYTFDIYAYDDCSGDGSWEKLVQYSQRVRLELFQGEKNMGPAFARDFLIRQVADPQTICVLLDMDDELLPSALSTLENAYRGKPTCWMTYGNWINQSGVVNDQGTYTAEELDNRAYRSQDVFKFTHLRSFRRFLYDKVTPEHLKGADGNWLRYCSDVGIMLPIADQCNSENVVSFDVPLYLYNQYRPSGTQKRFKDKKKEAFLYLRDKFSP